MQSLVAQRRLTVQPEETRALGARLGQWARAGDMVACCGALGAGKTTFVQGFAKGLGVGEEAYVRSPTFALVHAYHGHIPLYHFDFYRLTSWGEVQDIGFEEYLDARAVRAQPQTPGEPRSEEAVVEALIGGEHLGRGRDLLRLAERPQSRGLVPQEHLEDQDVNVNQRDDGDDDVGGDGHVPPSITTRAWMRQRHTGSAPWQLPPRGCAEAPSSPANPAVDATRRRFRRRRLRTPLHWPSTAC